MRYLGNKESMKEVIYKFLKSNNILGNDLVFFDAFSGTGAVSNYVMPYYDNLIINDNLKCSVVYTYGRLNANSCSFSKLGLDPFDFFNKSKDLREGFFYKNYSPGESERMYFTEENAKRIDYFRYKIEEWKSNYLIDEKEYCYLLASLIESVSKVSNTAGVYGAFLKKWDARALKDIEFIPVECNENNCKNIKVYNSKLEDIIENVNCDVLYLDPPYTQNQYGTQYHLLETLVLNDSPNISKITGSRATSPMRSDWSKEYKVNILFDYILAKTKAKYIVLSYNNDGLMSKDFIEASMKRYGKSETYICKKINYKKYNNWKSNSAKEHYEYLFFIEKKEINDVIYESPLNYIGSKAKIINYIKAYLPNSYDSFIDIFGGGFNVGINAECNDVIYNDINFYVKELVESFLKNDTYAYIIYIKKIIKQFKLEKGNKETYLEARKYYNSLSKENRDPRLLYTIILYGFQQQIRFNNNHEFNNPVGMRWFNDKILEKMISFSRRIKENNYHFKNNSYLYYKSLLDDSTFVYLDPPYELTTGSYNDGKRGFSGWNKDLELEFFDFVDYLNSKGIKFMLSYVKEHKGKTNINFINWINSHNYCLIELGEIIGISGSKRKEVLVINYERRTTKIHNKEKSSKIKNN